MTTVWSFADKNKISDRERKHDDMSLCTVFSDSLFTAFADKEINLFVHTT